MVAQQKIKDATLECTGTEISPTSVTSTKTNPGSPKSRLAMLKRSSTRTKTNTAASNDPFRFQGNGVDFKGKLIGERDVAEARGDEMCAEAMRLAKAMVKSAGSHKPRIILNISIEGLKIKDEKTRSILYNFPVSKISFIARDTTDARAFGFIFGTSDAKYKFYGIKTAQTADHAVLSIRDMFQVVFEMKKKQIQEVKQKKEEQENLENFQRETVIKGGETDNGCRMEGGVAVADLLDLESELQNLEQGFHQLQNIPSMPEDENFVTQWNSSGGTTAAGNGTINDPFDDSFFNSGVTPLQHAQVNNMSSMFNGTNGLAPSPPTTNVMNPAQNSDLNGAVSWLQPTNGLMGSTTVFNNVQQQCSAVYSGTNPFANIQQQSSQQVSTAFVQNGFSTNNEFNNGVMNGITGAPDPFDTQSAQRVINAINNVHSYGFLPPSLQQNMNNGFSSVLNQQQPMMFPSLPTSAPSSNSPPVPAVSPFVAASMAFPAQMQPFAPTPNIFSNNFNNNNNNNNNNEQSWAALSNGSMTLKENKAPTSNFLAFESDKSFKWTEPSAQRVTTLEEAFTKLVDMDQLVSINSVADVRKNPFEHIINPPKMPLNALLTQFP